MLMTTFAYRLKESREARGFTQDQLAEAAGVSQGLIHKIESGKTFESRKVSSLARALGVDVYWLATGKGNRLGSIDGMVTNKHYDGSVKDESPEYLKTTRAKIPLISWVSAGSWCEAIDNYSVGHAEDWYDCPIKCSSNTYALRVRGDSMTSAHGRSYPEGIIIYVDPQVAPASGNRVIAKIAGTNEVTFKELRFDSGRVLLKPLNPQYPTIDITDKEYNICGVIIGSYVPE